MADDHAHGDGLAAQASADPAEISAMYDDWAPTQYDDDLAAWGYDAPERVATVLAALTPDGPILDAGCGTGLVGVELHERGVGPLVGGDFSAASVETARARGVYAEVVDLDLNAPLPFADAKFRAAVSVGVFSYLVDAEATINELLRVVVPGGALIFTQRSDLWDERGFADLLERLADDDRCDVSYSEPQPYLPQHPEFGRQIGIRYATLIRC